MIWMEYVTNRKSICAADFERDSQKVQINPKFILSISRLQPFELPISGKTTKWEYSILTMSNGDRYVLNQRQHNFLQVALSQYQLKAKKDETAF